MNKLLLVVVFFLSISLFNCRNSNCVCTEQYQPVCGAKGGVFKTFPNACEAKCSGFLVQRQGPCFRKLQKIDPCIAKCPTDIEPVCGELTLSRHGTSKQKNLTMPNACFAQCRNAKFVTNGTCHENNRTRNLGAIKDFFKKLGDSIKKAFNRTERWIEEKSANVSSKVKTVWHQIGEKWESCHCEPFNDAVNWAKKMANKTKQLAKLTVEELRIIEHNTIEGFKLFKQKVVEKFHQIKNATIAGFKRFANKTKEFIQKVVRFIKNVTVEAAEWIIEEGQSLKNKTATWWHKTKQGLESCACELVKETEEVLEEIGRAAEKALNKTKAKLEQWRNKLKKNLIELKNKGKNALQKTKQWFQELWPCTCPRDYEPVCIETEDGDQATILNHCFADCARLRLKTISEGSCDENEKKEDL
jgi:ElaB/YqjD/DUF883 family membrane-anchored ribosome-binding protein